MLISKSEPNLTARHNAFHYQLQAVNAVKDRRYAALFHEQGLGKTKIGIDLALTWLKEGVVDSVLIVTKKSLVKNWTDEVRAHTFFQARLLSQDANSNFHAFNSPARIYITHYEVMKSEARRLKLFQKTRRVGVILDESQKIKNPDADLTKSLFDLAGGFAKRVIMTGTPVANRPYDIWAQIYFLDGGEALGNNFAEFRARLDLNNSLASKEADRDAFEAALGEVFEKISTFAVRETKGSAGIDLPEKSIQNVVVQLGSEQRTLYDSFRHDLGAEVLRDGLLVRDDADDILKRLLRLVQVASNPLLVDQSFKPEPAKFAAAEQLVLAAIRNETKVIVWTAFIENAQWLAQKFQQQGAALVHGARSIADRNDAIARFKSDPECRVLVATPGAAKEGLTLTVASHAIFYDRSFSLDDYLQAQDRIHRISQSKPCYIWNLIAQDSVDEWVDLLLNAKQLAAQRVQGDIGDEEYKEKANYEFGRVVREILGLHHAD